MFDLVEVTQKKLDLYMDIMYGTRMVTLFDVLLALERIGSEPQQRLQKSHGPENPNPIRL